MPVVPEGFLEHIVNVGWGGVKFISYLIDDPADDFSGLGIAVGSNAALSGFFVPFNGAQLTGRVWLVEVHQLGILVNVVTVAPLSPDVPGDPVITAANESFDIAAFGDAFVDRTFGFQFALFGQVDFDASKTWGCAVHGQEPTPKRTYTFSVPSTPATPFFMIAGMNKKKTRLGATPLY